ncbi:MAG: endonuclease III domain-containing protein [Geobacter sp.]
MTMLTTIFDRLLERYGHRDWWPAESPFEVGVGAILTQNTNWGNVEKAIANLKAADCLTLSGIAALPSQQLAALIRPAGYFNVKARRLQSFCSCVLEACQGDLEQLFAQDWRQLRPWLLAINGIGPETADSILLYAANQPSFVVDAYTRRIFSRLGLVDETIAYEPLRSFCMQQLPEDPALFNEFHALIVEHGKQHCRPRPRCEGCCLAIQCNQLRQQNRQPGG